jgi:hypothetical protein
MSTTYQTITVNSLINKWNETSEIFNELPEFCFIPPLAAKIKAKNCTCGLGSEIAAATTAFNLVVDSLPDSSVVKMKSLFQTEQLCFGIQTSGNFEVKCY